MVYKKISTAKLVLLFLKRMKQSICGLNKHLEDSFSHAIKTVLQIGDVCIALRHVEGGETSGISGRSTIRPHSGTRGGLVPSTSGIQQLARPTSLIQAPRRHLSPIIRAERRPGVRSAPSHEIPSEELAMLDARRRMKGRRHKSVL